MLFSQAALRLCFRSSPSHCSISRLTHSPASRCPCSHVLLLYWQAAWQREWQRRKVTVVRVRNERGMEGRKKGRGGGGRQENGGSTPMNTLHNWPRQGINDCAEEADRRHFEPLVISGHARPVTRQQWIRQNVSPHKNQSALQPWLSCCMHATQKANVLRHFAETLSSNSQDCCANAAIAL
jgi:hypothetical protein